MFLLLSISIRIHSEFYLHANVWFLSLWISMCGTPLQYSEKTLKHNQSTIEQTFIYGQSFHTIRGCADIHIHTWIVVWIRLILSMAGAYSREINCNYKNTWFYSSFEQQEASPLPWIISTQMKRYFYLQAVFIYIGKALVGRDKDLSTFSECLTAEKFSILAVGACYNN